VFTARYALSPYIKQIRFVFKGLNILTVTTLITVVRQPNIHYFKRPTPSQRKQRLCTYHGDVLCFPRGRKLILARNLHEDKSSNGGDDRQQH
jgi:hypothetical protein